MGAPHCDMCAAMGYRTCNLCRGGIVFLPHPLLGDVCEYCLTGHLDDGLADDDDTPETGASGLSHGGPTAPALAMLPDGSTGGRKPVACQGCSVP